MKKFISSAALLLFLLTLAASGATAAEVAVSNSVGIRLSLTFAYTDETTGVMVTRGWWHVEPGQTLTVDLPAKSSHPIYMAAFNKDQYIDRTNRTEHVVRWASSRRFVFSSDDDTMPDGESVWQAKYYRVPGNRVDINGRPGR